MYVDAWDVCPDGRVVKSPQRTLAYTNFVHMGLSKTPHLPVKSLGHNFGRHGWSPNISRIYLYDCSEYAHTMANSDGRSIFAALYIGLALVSLLLFFVSMETATGLNGAGIIVLSLLFTVIFGILGMYKLLTLSKGKSNNDDEINIEGEKSRNSNLEVQIWRNKIIVAIIILILLFFITRF